MDADDLEPQKAKPKRINLDPLSVDELNAYIVELETEILRARADIDKKLKHKASVEALFKR
jgi:uncharacterized small protein (DUF1192 family)